MGKLTRYEFLGNKLVLLILCTLLPLGIVYFLQCSVLVEEEMENPSEFLDKWKAGKINVL